ncbi:MAG TPA: hypothetical protein VGR62_10100 [Candidatus Binatia bacterium]|jgi:hypothetical protein|nr:hypothetical protein [Candidatus Binatia bacterium]
MDDLDGFRQRLLAAGVQLPDAVVPMIAVLAGPMVTALDALAALDLGDVEPFDPARMLVRDAD